MAPEGSIPTAALVVVGNEVLSAKVRDENTPFLLDRLRRLGVRAVKVTVVPDEREVLVATYREAVRSATWVFSTGGVGPTHDDVTMGAVAEAFGRPIRIDPELERLIREHFGASVNEHHLKMAALPEGAELEWGKGLRLPVVRIENLWIFPGSPGLVRSKFLGIEERFRQAPFFLRRLQLDVDEPEIAGLLAEAEASEAGISIGSYPVHGLFDHKVEVTVEGKDEAAVLRVTGRIRSGLPEGVLLREL